jgi:phospholipid-binding lipoprotein MlaA
MPASIRAAAGALALALLAGCATTGPRTPGDPLERVNRATYRFNSAVDRAVLKPVATGYRDHVPQVVRTGVDNFLDNLAYPTTIVNDLLQLKIKDTLADIGRFAVNSTLGLAGLFDPASAFGIPRNNEDFGQTLGRWGVPSGPYLVLPFLGPSNLRDAPSLYVDGQVDLRVALDVDTGVRWGLAGLSVVNRRAELLAFDGSIDAAYDPYAFVRNAWRQRREYQVKDGDVPDDIPLDESADEPLVDPETGETVEVPTEDAPPPEATPSAPEPQAEPPPPEPEDQPPGAGASSSATSLIPASDATAGGTFR